MADKPPEKSGRFDTGLIRELAAILREADLGEISLELFGCQQNMNIVLVHGLCGSPFVSLLLSSPRWQESVIDALCTLVCFNSRECILHSSTSKFTCNKNSQNNEITNVKSTEATRLTIVFFSR